jgi:Golgi phosphoprotein 3 (GPP34)
MTTIAEDLAVLLLDPHTGRRLVDGTAFDRALAGAILLDLALAGALTPDGAGAKARLTPSGPAPADPLLQAALTRLTPGPYKAQRAVERLARGCGKRVLELLDAHGAAERTSRRVFGIFPSTAWMLTARSQRPAVLADVTAALQGRTVPAPRTACLISLLHAVKAEHKLVDGSKKELRARAQEIARSDFAGPAVRKAVEAVQAAAVATIVAVNVTVSGS